MKDTAFIQRAAWERVFAALAGTLGLAVSGGEKSDLPGGGNKITFDTGSAGAQRRRPFTVTQSGASLVSVTAGAVFWGGRCLPVAETMLGIPPEPWLVWLEMGLAAVTDGVSSWVVDRAVYPDLTGVRFRLRSGVLSQSSSLTEPCTITDIAGVISQTPGVMRWPLACGTGLGVQQMWDGPLILEMEPNGRVMPAQIYPVEGG